MCSTRGNMSRFAVLILIVTLRPRIRRVSCKLIDLHIETVSQSITRHTDGKWDSEKDEFTRNTTVAVKEVVPHPMRSRLGLPGRNSCSQRSPSSRRAKCIYDDALYCTIPRCLIMCLSPHQRFYRNRQKEYQPLQVNVYSVPHIDLC